MIKVANAPCSWGALEFNLKKKSEKIGFEQVLDEIAATGYIGTELGDLGFMPSEPKTLEKEIKKRKLELIGAFVPVALKDANNHEKGVSAALQVAGLMFESGYSKALIVLSDDNGTIEERTKNAGRIHTGMGLNDDQWKVFAEGAEKIAQAVRDTYEMKTVFHHHCAGYVETPQEIHKLMKLTDPQLLGLCLDTGHYTFGNGNPIEALKKYYKRIWHIHFKDFDPNLADASRKVNGDYFDAIGKGVFCKLGLGRVDFKEIITVLNELEYNDWIVVEQDILPGMGNPITCAQYNRDFLKKLGI